VICEVTAAVYHFRGGSAGVGVRWNKVALGPCGTIRRRSLGTKTAPTGSTFFFSAREVGVDSGADAAGLGRKDCTVLKNPTHTHTSKQRCHWGQLSCWA